MATRETVGAKVDADTKRELEQYREQHDHDSESDAVRELLEIGLRESSNPVVFRLKDRVVEWASMLGIAAVIVLVAGGATAVIAVSDAAKLSVSLLGAAIVLLGVFELTRVALGINRLGSVMRDVLGGESA